MKTPSALLPTFITLLLLTATRRRRGFD